MQLAHPVPFAATGNASGVYAPVVAGYATIPPQVTVVGITAENTTATAASIIVRDGGSTGNILVAGQVAAAVAGTPGTLDRDLTHPRQSSNGIYIEVTGGAAVGVLWVT